MVGLLPAYKEGIILINDSYILELVMDEKFHKRMEKCNDFNSKLYAGMGGSSLLNV